MKTYATPGCCHGRIMYDLGGAHGVALSKNQKEFDQETNKQIISPLNIAITVNYQSYVRDFLKVQGWEEQKVGGTLTVHTISGSKLRSYLNEQKRKWKEEEVVIKSKFKSPNATSKFAKGILPARPEQRPGPVRLNDIRADYRIVRLSIFNQLELYALTPQQRLDFKNRLENIYQVEIKPIEEYWNIFSLHCSIAQRVAVRRSRPVNNTIEAN